jgi:putative restriction endonuclease
MTRDELLSRFSRLAVWRRGDQRAPHKPLLALYALGRWANGQRDAVPFRDAARDLTALLREFGPPRRSDHPEQPFWRLQRDGVWSVQSDGPRHRAGAAPARRKRSCWPAAPAGGSPRR